MLHPTLQQHAAKLRDMVSRARLEANFCQYQGAIQSSDYLAYDYLLSANGLRLAADILQKEADSVQQKSQD